jgi:predicted DNA repair protein MutK
MNCLYILNFVLVGCCFLCVRGVHQMWWRARAREGEQKRKAEAKRAKQAKQENTHSDKILVQCNVMRRGRKQTRIYYAETLHEIILQQNAGMGTQGRLLF